MYSRSFLNELPHKIAAVFVDCPDLVVVIMECCRDARKPFHLSLGTVIQRHLTSIRHSTHIGQLDSWVLTLKGGRKPRGGGRTDERCHDGNAYVSLKLKIRVGCSRDQK